MSELQGLFYKKSYFHLLSLTSHVKVFIGGSIYYYCPKRAGGKKMQNKPIKEIEDIVNKQILCNIMWGQGPYGKFYLIDSGDFVVFVDEKMILYKMLENYEYEEDKKYVLNIASGETPDGFIYYYLPDIPEAGKTGGM